MKALRVNRSCINEIVGGRLRGGKQMEIVWLTSWWMKLYMNGCGHITAKEFSDVHVNIVMKQF